METNDLLEVFGGRDNLRLMCGAIRFRYGKGRVSFWVSEHIVRLHKRESFYIVQVQVRKTRIPLCDYTSICPEVIRDRFERYTGYVLSF